MWKIARADSLGRRGPDLRAQKPLADGCPSMALHTWLLYLVAVIGLSLTPGPNGLLALTHGALYGHRRTLWTVAGGVSGFAVLMALSMFGIGALLKASVDALILLKWLPRAPPPPLGVRPPPAPAPLPVAPLS